MKLPENLYHTKLNSKFRRTMNIKNKVFYREIIHPNILQEFLKLEKPIMVFETEINNVDKSAFATFLAKQRKEAKIEIGSIVLFRAKKNKKTFEFTSKLGNWGKFHIPKELVETLRIKNHERIVFETIAKNSKPIPRAQPIDLADITSMDSRLKIILRPKGFVTIWKKAHTPITVPRFLEPSEDLFVFAYLMHGDGHYKSKFFFSNASYRLHRFVMEKFEEIFTLPKNMWRCRVSHHKEDPAVKIYWKKALGFSEEQFYPKISRTRFGMLKRGNARTTIDYKLVATVFRFVFGKLNDMIDEGNALHALDGILNAEGSAGIYKNGLHKLTISFSQSEKDMFAKILRKCGFLGLCNCLNDRFVMGDWNNFYQLIRKFHENRLVPFSQNPVRSANVVNGLLNHRYTKTITKYLKAIDDDGRTFAEIAKGLGHKRASVAKELRNKRFDDFIKIEGRGINRSPLRVSISKEGLGFLEVIKWLEQQRPIINKLLIEDEQLERRWIS
ncbi:MAG: hypothetical protein ACE5J7_03310 [Candidatus Aenigmatarchaeota archaeon]